MPTKKATNNVAKKAVKKAASKNPAKKTVAKNAVKKTAGKKNKKQLVYADNKKSFWVTNGQILDSLIALRDALDEMEKEVYSYHAGKAHNDFANWVELVLDDAACAADLHKAKTPRSAKTVVVKHLKYYTL